MCNRPFFLGVKLLIESTDDMVRYVAWELLRHSERQLQPAQGILLYNFCIYQIVIKCLYTGDFPLHRPRGFGAVERINIVSDAFPVQKISVLRFDIQKKIVQISPIGPDGLRIQPFSHETVLQIVIQHFV